ncbi:MAG TPA: 50S ribosomal protein L28 [Thermoanaerobacterales bacterium]|nr:50S ribosomal protein L28 [Thermoanaerobacterales bacterium]
MANICEICGKSSISGHNVSHSNIKTKRKWKPNIKKVKAIVNNQTKRINVCTVCLKSGKVTRSI